ncbi:aspartate/glutamate racemase family protein [Flavisolibacter ginsenosidimutans]|uniref:Aspartate/glutamate racemase family protein n=1 Tax=Flavisolibacter ginsenosidimutans TaxID=661481 RepID=A0A5B8UIF7_9BACT|nr:aspartate/glutamate racemase family protein [Flavisolibacter ginsenosidimutans]QEC56313.1 aspartate/glutamate racemase family protein [Flavisolibacter ginsenosidimutans]
MQTLGLIGGVSWVSTINYYRQINEGINDALGGLNFSRCIIYSFNYADIKKNIDSDDWEATFEMVAMACRHFKTAGATGIVLCANTLHLMADRIEKEIGLPVVHIATATAMEIEKAGLKKVGLLGTKFTMELNFFTSKLIQRGMEVIVPNEEDREFVHDTIYNELGKGVFTLETKRRYLAIIDKLVKEGAEGIILGCTEIPLLIHAEDVPVPTFDTGLLHSQAAVEFSLQ